jgi:hypothetical protein
MKGAAMVTYELESREGDVLIYLYWPEGDREAKPGRFTINLATGTASVDEPAERDVGCRTTGAEMNGMRDAINEMRAQDGEPPLSEEELPAEPEDLVSEWWYYFDHALQDLSRRHDAGEIAERGAVSWF